MRVFDNLFGFFLYLKKVKSFDFQELFKGKRVVVIGAADSAYEKELGRYIDGFDFVIRINKALITYNENQAKFIGKKTDVLIHNFHENMDDGGGGPIDWTVFDSFQLKYLVQSKSDFLGKRNVFNYFKKYQSESREVHLLDSNTYANIKKEFGSSFPTRGLLGIYSSLISNAKEVYLTGFTFFKTPYANGYRDNIKSVSETLKHIDRQNIHDAELEFQNFLKILSSSSVEKIILDDALYQIVRLEEKRTTNDYLKYNVSNINDVYSYEI